MLGRGGRGGRARCLGGGGGGGRPDVTCQRSECAGSRVDVAFYLFLQKQRLGMEKSFIELVRMNKCVVPNSGVGFRIQVNGKTVYRPMHSPSRAPLLLQASLLGSVTPSLHGLMRHSAVHTHIHTLSSTLNPLNPAS